MLRARDAAEIAARYRLGDDAALTGPVARGEQGAVWKLTTSAGTWAVKVLLERCLEADVRDEAGYQTAALAAGVPTPVIVRTAEGAVLADLGHAQVRTFGWVDLLEPDPHLDPHAVGTVVSAIHRVHHRSGAPVDPWYTEPVGADRWDDLVSASLARGAPFAGRLAEMRDELVALEALLEAPADLQICHRDLWADNLRATAAGGLCVIDWTDCGLGDPSQELALVLFEFARGDAERARRLHDAYVDSGGPGRVDRPERFSMVIAQLAHIGERACRRWLEPDASAGDQERATERVDEFLSDDALTRAVIEQLLDAVTGRG